MPGMPISCLCPPNSEGCGSVEEVAGSVVEVNLGSGDNGGAEVEEEIDEAEMRCIEYGSVPAFALLQSRENALADAAAMSSISSVPASLVTQNGSNMCLNIAKSLATSFGNQDSPPAFIFEDPKTILKLIPFYVDKQLQSWLPECLVDWYFDNPCN